MAGDEQHARADIEFHRETAAAYDAETTREYAIYHESILKPFLARVFEPGMSAIDLGAGTGVVAIALAECGFRVLAVDHSPDMLAIAREKAEAHGVSDRIEFAEGDLDSAPVPAGGADLVTAQGVLHHLADPAAGVEALVGALRPGGHFFVSEPCVERTPVGRAIEAVMPALFRIRRAVLRREANVGPPTVERPISAELLLELLRARGLSFEAEFRTHLPRAHRWAGDRLRLWLTRLVSWPWRRRRGDLVFVLGELPR